jgi:CRP/FNR family cyclic AMP-dependent transcriptional regulator
MVTNVLKTLKKSGIVQDDSEHRLTISNWFMEELASNPAATPPLTPPDCQCFNRRSI